MLKKVIPKMEKWRTPRKMVQSRTAFQQFFSARGSLMDSQRSFYDISLEVWRKFCFIVFISSVSSITVEELCQELIPDDYKIYEPPKINGKPLNVFIGFQVLDIGEINEEKMDYHLHLFIVYAWNDTRLKLEKYTNLGRPAILYSECKNHIWTPDVFFETAKRIETFERTSPTTILNIFEDGSIVVSVRYSFTSDCSMDFHYYPFDTQRCTFHLSLMQSHDSIATLKWLDDKECPIRDPPIQMMRDIDLLRFYLLDPVTSSFTKVESGANYTVLAAEFTIVRRLTGCIISTFAPCVLVVIMSWVTFWLKMNAIPARVALSITSLLTLCTQADNSKSHLPPINYMTALDVWLFMCMISVFSTLFVTALSNNLFFKKCEACMSAGKQATDKQQGTINGDGTNYDKKTYPRLQSNRTKQKLLYGANFASETNNFQEKQCPLCLSNTQLGERIDNSSKFAFPVTFSLAVFGYCCYYLSIQ